MRISRRIKTRGGLTGDFVRQIDSNQVMNAPWERLAQGHEAPRPVSTNVLPTRQQASPT